MKAEDLVKKMLDEIPTEKLSRMEAHDISAGDKLFSQNRWHEDARLEAYFNENGVDCSYDYPGYFCCPVPGGTLNVGTVDGFWGADISDDEGRNIPLSPEAESAFEHFQDVAPSEVSKEQLLAAIKLAMNVNSSNKVDVDTGTPDLPDPY
jgi:hypothetical protein